MALYSGMLGLSHLLAKEQLSGSKYKVCKQRWPQFTECEGRDLRAFEPYSGFLTSEEEHDIIRSGVCKHFLLA